MSVNLTVKIVDVDIVTLRKRYSPSSELCVLIRLSAACLILRFIQPLVRPEDNNVRYE